jgi:ribosomal protein L28
MESDDIDANRPSRKLSSPADGDESSLYVSARALMSIRGPGSRGTLSNQTGGESELSMLPCGKSGEVD